MPDLGFGIVDPHVHQWDPRTTPREVSPLARTLGGAPRLYEALARRLIPRATAAFLGDPRAVLFSYLPADYARDRGALPVERVVHVQASWRGRGVLGAVGETQWLESLDFGSAGLELAAIVGHVDLRAPRADTVLAAHVATSPRFRGVRQMAAHHPARGVMSWTRRPHLYHDREFFYGYEKLAARGLRFDAWVYSHQLRDVADLAERFPEVPVVLDHLGTPVAACGPHGGAGRTPQERDRIVAQWRDDLARVAEHRHVHVKLSGLAMPVVGFGFERRSEPPSVEALTDAFRPFVQHGLSVFGVERAFFASNFPMDRASAPLERIYAAYVTLAQEAGPEAPRALLRDNAMRFYAIE